MINKNILKLEINNNTKHLEKYLRAQWSWKTYFFIFSLISVLAFIVIDLEINFIELFSDSSKYFGDILNRMLPPDFSNFGNLTYAMLETIEIAFLGTFIAIVLSIPVGLFSARNLAPNYGVFLVARIVTIFFRAIPEFIIALAIPTLCLCPPESSSARLYALSTSPTVSSAFKASNFCSFVNK